MGCAVLTDGDTGMGCADFNIQVGVTDGVTHLLERTACCKHRKGAGKRNEALRGKTCCNTHQVRLGNAAVEEPLGKCVFESNGHGRLCKVGVQNHQFIIFCAKLGQRVAIGLSCCLLYYFSHGYFASLLMLSSIASRSLMAWANCSSLGAAPCQEA